jgi:uncharacterized protein DUF5907
VPALTYEIQANVHDVHEVRQALQDLMFRVIAGIDGRLASVEGSVSSGFAPSSASYAIIGGGSGDGLLTEERTLAVGAGASLVLVDGGANGSATLTRGALTGDVTASADSNTTTIANDAVTLAKIQNAVANSKLLGSGAAGAGADYSEITLGTNLSMSGTTLNASGGGMGGSTGATDNAVLRADGTGGSTLQNSTVTIDDLGQIVIPNNSSLILRNTSSTIASPSSGAMTLEAFTALHLNTQVLQVVDDGAKVLLEVSRLGGVPVANHLVIGAPVSGVAPAVTAVGSDTDISINLVPKGAGHLQENGANVLTTTTGQTLDATLTSLAAVAGIQGDLLYASGADTWTRLAKDANATRYLSNTGTTNNPAWAQVDLTNGVTGDLPFSSLAQGSARSVLGVTGNAAADVTSIQGTADQVLVVNGAGTALAFGTVATNGITAKAVTFAKMQDISTGKLLGRNSIGTGVIEQITPGGGVEYDGSGTLQTSAFTGDVTKTAGGTALTIANDAVTYAKMQNVSATDKVLGRSTAGAGDPEEIACTAAGRALIDDADAAAQRTTLGLGTKATQNQSGDVVARVIRALPPATLFAQEGVLAGASTPVESVGTYDFDASTIEYMDFLCRLSPKYSGGGLTMQPCWTSLSATSGVCRWGFALRRCADDAEDIAGTSQTYSYTDVDCTAPTTTAGKPQYDSVAMADGSAIDNVAAGEMFILRVRRNASHANDTMTGDARLFDIEIRET